MVLSRITAVISKPLTRSHLLAAGRPAPRPSASALPLRRSTALPLPAACRWPLTRCARQRPAPPDAPQPCLRPGPWRVRRGRRPHAGRRSGIAAHQCTTLPRPRAPLPRAALRATRSRSWPHRARARACDPGARRCACASPSDRWRPLRPDTLRVTGLRSMPHRPPRPAVRRPFTAFGRPCAGPQAAFSDQPPPAPSTGTAHASSA